MVIVASDTGAAQGAASGVQATGKVTSQTADVSQSNIAAMTTGADVANSMVDTVNSFIESVKTQAEKFPQLASAMEVRDGQAAQSMNSGNGGK